MEGERVILMPVEPADAPRIHSCRSDPLVRRFLASPHRLDSLERIRRRISERVLTGDVTAFKIVEKSTGKPAGIVTLAVNHRAKRAELGYRVCRDKRNRGLATEAVRLAIEYARNVLGLRMIFARVKEFNVASMRVLIRNGFKLCGRLPEFTIVPGYGRVALLEFCLVLRDRVYLHARRRNIERAAVAQSGRAPGC